MKDLKLEVGESMNQRVMTQSQRRLSALAALLLSLIMINPAHAEDDLGLVEDYLAFVDYFGGSISYGQIPEAERKDMVYIDVRNAEEYNEFHIPGALNIEWRTILDNQDQVPTDKPVILYCNSGVVSSQAMMALRMAGFENIRTMSHGLQSYRATVDKTGH
jgi:rhodanese-related sulfurtransferase